MGRYERDSERYSRSTSKHSQGIPAGIVVLLMISTAVGGYFAKPYIDELWAPLPAPTTQATAAAPQPAPPPTKASEPAATDGLEIAQVPPAPIILPALDSSDEQARAAITAAEPDIAPWLGNEDLIRHFVLIANDAAQGQRVKKHFDFIKLPKPFAVKEGTDGGLLIAPESYHRYDSLAAAINKVDSNALNSFYQTFKPLLQQAFAELGYPDDYSLATLLDKAGAQIISAPIIEGEIPIIKHSLNYQFADPQLEAINPIHKQMLRMGPENTRLIQNKVKALQEKLRGAKG